jgi:hypothetical protein
MHFSMEAYANIATLLSFSKYGICEGKCVDKVLWGASVGAIVMRRLEEKGWGGKVTWTSLWREGGEWLLEEVDAPGDKPAAASH